MSAARGHSLLELMIGLALVATVASTAMNLGKTWRWPMVARQETQQVITLITSLRQHSLRDGRPWQLCTSRDGRLCDSIWQGAWLIFSDVNGNQQRDAGEPLRQHARPLPDGWRLLWRGFSPAILWGASGDASQTNGTLTLCPPAPHDASLRQVVISKSGRIRLIVPLSVAATLKSARAVCGWP